MSEWAETTLGSVACVNPESTPKDWPGTHEIKYIDIASVSRDRGIDDTSLSHVPFASAPGRARRRVRSRDILVSTVRPNLRAFAVVPPSLDGEVASTGFAVIRANESAISPGFAWCIVSSDAFVDGMVSRCTGSNYPAIRGDDVAAYDIALPPVLEQRRIVAVMSAVDAQIEALQTERATLDRAYLNALSLLWLNSDGSEAPVRPLADLMRVDLDRVKVDLDTEYLIAGVLNAGKGLISHGPVSGAATGYNTLNRLSEGQVVMRKLTAWEGPIGVVPQPFDGFFASAEFPTFTLDNGLLGPYFDHVCRSRRLWDEMKNRVTGSVQRRKRLNPDELLRVALPIPPFEVQVSVAAALDGMRDTTGKLTAELAALRTARAGLLTALLSQEISVNEAVDRFVEVAS